MPDKDAVQSAFDCIGRTPVREGIGVKIGSEEIFHHYLDIIIDEHLTFDVHEKSITHNEVANALEDLFIQIARDHREGKLSEPPAEVFHRKKGMALSKLFSEELEMYRLAFPLNLGYIESEIDGFHSLESEFRRISEDSWAAEYLRPAKAADGSYLEKFLDISPNDFADKRFAYFVTEYDARSEMYSLSRIQDLVRLALGRLNYCIHKGSRGPPESTSSKSLPNETWAALKEPAFYLVFDESEYLFTRPMDYGYRRNIGTSRRRAKQISYFYSMPRLSEDDEVDELLISALMSFQDGVSEPSQRKSFFSFWRGIEVLSQRRDTQDQVKERARFAHEYILEDSDLFPSLQRAHNQIHDVRNSVAHDGVDTYVGSDHRNYAKVLLDSMIELYFDERDEFNKEDFKIFLDSGVEFRNKSGKLLKILQKSSL